MMSTTAELLLVRHGQSEGNVGLSCDPDCALTEAGRASVDAALDQLLARERVLLDGLSPEDSARLAALLRVLTTPFDAR